MKLIAPYYVQKERGGKLIPLEKMLRMYLMQNWFGLSDEGHRGCHLRQLRHEALSED